MTEKKRAYIAAYYQRPEVLAKRPHCIDCGKMLCTTAQYSGTKRCNGCAKRLDNTGRRHTAETKAKIAAAHIGKPRSPETKEKLRLAHLGTHASEETRAKLRGMRAGEKHPMWGKHHTAESKTKMSLARIGKTSGPNHPCYRDGRGTLPYTPDWHAIKPRIYARDERLCQHPACYSPENGKHHDCHHIDFNKENNEPANLILLCRKHHAKTFFGDRNYWTEFYNSVQEMRGIEIAINLGG